MSDIADSPELLQFGTFEVNLRSGELRKGGVKVKLSGQPFQVLSILLERPGDIFTREELQKRLWPDTFVDVDHNLNTAINKIREVLGDSAESPRFVETLPRRGYRFIYPLNGGSRIRQTSPADGPTSTTKPARPRFLTPWTIVGYSAAALLLAVAVFFIPRLRKLPAPAQRSLTRLTFDDGLQFGATWSPDGRFLAYSSDRGGKFDIWVQQVSGGDPVQITKGVGHNWQPDWSPDGNYIAYRSESGDGGLFIVPALGGAGLERRISSFGYHPHWSPDGSQILFQTHFTLLDTNDNFYVVPLDGSQPRQILAQSIAEHDLWPASAMWHPDGKRVTVWVGRSSRDSSRSPNLWTIPIAGGAAVKTEIPPAIEKQLEEAAGNSVRGEWPVDFTFTWSPSGKAIYFERAYRSVRNIWKLTIDRETLKATSIERLTTGAGPDTEAAVSRDGTRLAFTASSEHVRPWIFPFNAARGVTAGEGRAIASSGGRAQCPTLSDDSTRLAFAAERGGSWLLWQKLLTGGPEEPILSDEYARNCPQWSPNGNRLAYLREQQGRQQIVTFSVDNRIEDPVTAPTTKGWQVVSDWSPDGKNLLVSQSDDTKPFEVWRLPLDAAPHAEVAGQKIITSPTVNIFQSQFSPDAKWIAFETVEEKPTGMESAIYAMPSTGGEWIPLHKSRSWDDKPRWSHDGKTIYFISGQGGFFNVLGLRFDPSLGKPIGQAFPVTSFDKPNLMISRQIEGADLSIVQDRMALLMDEMSGGIWLLDNVDQ